MLTLLVSRQALLAPRSADTARTEMLGNGMAWPGQEGARRRGTVAVKNMAGPRRLGATGDDVVIEAETKAAFRERVGMTCDDYASLCLCRCVLYTFALLQSCVHARTAMQPAWPPSLVLPSARVVPMMTALSSPMTVLSSSAMPVCHHR
jgi:hypothetical protein